MTPDDSPSGSVVVPIDGTDDSFRAIPLASRLADALGRELVVVSVVGDFRSEAPPLVDRLRDRLRDLPTTIERRIVQSRTIASTIAEESRDGIVCMATSAEVFENDGFRYTVTDRVIAAATAPVIVIGPRCPQDATISRVVVAIDPQHEQSGLLHWSARLGYELDVPVEFVHVAIGDSPPLGEKIRELQPAAGQSVADRLLEESVDALLAMGSHGRTGFRRLIQGSVGAAVIPHSSAPVMVLGPEARHGDTDR